VILAAGTLAQTGYTTVSVGLPALAPALRSDYGLTLGETGVVLGAVGVGMLLTLLPWGLLADRLGERTIIAIGLLGAGACLVAAGLSESYPALVGWLAASGAFGASVNAASGRAVMAWFDADERGFALGIRQTAIPIGGAAGAVALPWLGSDGDTFPAFIALAAGAAIGAVAAIVLLREAPAAAAPATTADLRGPLRDLGMWLLAGGSSLFVVAQLAIGSFIVLFLHDYRGLSAHRAAAVLAAINVIGIATRIAAGRWSDRTGSRLRPMRSIGALLAVAMTIVTALLDAPLSVLVPAFVVAGVLGISWNGLSFTAAAESAGLARSGAALGFQQTMLSVVGAAFPPAFAGVVSASSWRTAFALCVLGPVLGLAALWRVREPTATGRRRETSAMPPGAR
jgi:sugar phosphate permease